MSVKKIGSKLAQGVRQVKAQQVSSLVEALETRMPSPVTPAPSAPSVTKPEPTASSVVKPAAKEGVPKSATLDSRLAGMQHPSRVWPD